MSTLPTLERLHSEEKCLTGTWRDLEALDSRRIESAVILSNLLALRISLLDHEKWTAEWSALNYYKDTRGSGGRLKHGHGPGGAPALAKDECLDLIEKLVANGFLRVSDLRRLASRHVKRAKSSRPRVR